MVELIVKLIATGVVLTANYLFWRADSKNDLYLKIFIVLGLAIALLIEIICGVFLMGKAYVDLLAAVSLAIILSALFPLVQFVVKVYQRIAKNTFARMRVDPSQFGNSFLGLCYFGISAMQLVVIWTPFLRR